MENYHNKKKDVVIISGNDIPRIIEMNEELTRNNNELANRNHEILTKHKIKSIDVVGSIGSGKTSVISKIASILSEKKKIYVICGDITLRLDADRIQKYGAKTIQINTGRECALNAYHIKKVLDALPLDEIDLRIVEMLKFNMSLRFHSWNG